MIVIDCYCGRWDGYTRVLTFAQWCSPPQKDVKFVALARGHRQEVAPR